MNYMGMLTAILLGNIITCLLSIEKYKVDHLLFCPCAIVCAGMFLARAFLNGISFISLNHVYLAKNNKQWMGKILLAFVRFCFWLDKRTLAWGWW
ncbi:hypothetical protein CsSME_00024337 [Camellia sinensis var. sinensis]